ncbi:MAG: ABC transporter permease [Planctomycetes bacterium]|nr:ABC transporter permease [Planctomycetota bacterium]
MPIFSQGYRAWSGTLHGRLSRLLAVAALELHIQVRRVGLWIFYAIALLLTGGAFLILYFLMNGFMGSPPALPANAGPIVAKSLCLEFNLKFVTPILVAIAGGGAIARDRRYNAHLLYFSKALRPADYLAGKALALGLLVGMSGLVPAVLYFGAIFDRSNEIYSSFDLVRLLLAMVVEVALFTLYYVGAVFAFSSLTKSRVLPGILFMSFLWVLWFFGHLYNIVQSVQLAQESARSAEEGEGGTGRMLQRMFEGSEGRIEGARPVAVYVVRSGSSHVRKVIHCTRPGSFDEENWRRSTPMNWQYRDEWARMEVESVEANYEGTSYEWLQLLNQFVLVGRVADAFYPEPSTSKLDLKNAMDYGGPLPPQVVLPVWQVACVYAVLTAAGYALVLWRLRSFERRAE